MTSKYAYVIFFKDYFKGTPKAFFLNFNNFKFLSIEKV